MQNPETEPTISQEDAVEVAAEKTPEPKPPAITITIQSWVTPIAALVILVVGFFAGYYVRPLVNKGTTADKGSAPEAAVPAPTVDPDRAAQQQALMEAVTSVTRHFRGNPDAAITIIEFGDFQ